MASTNRDQDDTEQTLTCLHVKMYHPQQRDGVIFSAIDYERQELKSEEVVFFGRDIKTTFKLLHHRVSRMQFALQFFKPLNSSTFSFEIKNLSKKTKLYVDGLELNYLNKIDLPPKCMIRFGEFQMLMENEAGESEDKFAVCCKVSHSSLVQELDHPVMLAIPEDGPLNDSLYHDSAISRTPFPVEVDEDD